MHGADKPVPGDLVYEKEGGRVVEKDDEEVKQSMVGRLLAQSERWTTGPEDPVIKNVAGVTFEGESACP